MFRDASGVATLSSRAQVPSPSARSAPIRSATGPQRAKPMGPRPSATKPDIELTRDRKARGMLSWSDVWNRTFTTARATPNVALPAASSGTGACSASMARGVASKVVASWTARSGRGNADAQDQQAALDPAHAGRRSDEASGPGVIRHEGEQGRPQHEEWSEGEPATLNAVAPACGPARRSRKAPPTSWSIGAWPSRSRHAGRDAAPTPCFRSAAPYAMARSPPASATCSSRFPIRARNRRWQHNFPNFWTVPFGVHTAAAAWAGDQDIGSSRPSSMFATEPTSWCALTPALTEACSVVSTTVVPSQECSPERPTSQNCHHVLETALLLPVHTTPGRYDSTLRLPAGKVAASRPAWMINTYLQ